MRRENQMGDKRKKQREAGVSCSPHPHPHRRPATLEQKGSSVINMFQLLFRETRGFRLDSPPRPLLHATICKPTDFQFQTKTSTLNSLEGRTPPTTPPRNFPSHLSGCKVGLHPRWIRVRSPSGDETGRGQTPQTCKGIHLSGWHLSEQREAGPPFLRWSPRGNSTCGGFPRGRTLSSSENGSHNTSLEVGPDQRKMCLPAPASHCTSQPRPFQARAFLP